MSDLIEKTFYIWDDYQLDFLQNYIQKYKEYLDEEIDMLDYKHARYNFKDSELSTKLFEIMKENINKFMPNATHISSKWYINRYFPDSGSIDKHIDGNYSYDQSISMYTILIYLNDNFDEGETVLYLNDNEQLIKPCKNRILMLGQKVYHSANKCKKNSKYILRGDLMFNLKHWNNCTRSIT